MNKKMGIIKEPKGIDFYFINRPLSTEEKEEVSNFIKRDKESIKKRILRQSKLQKN